MDIPAVHAIDDGDADAFSAALHAADDSAALERECALLDRALERRAVAIAHMLCLRGAPLVHTHAAVWLERGVYADDEIVHAHLERLATQSTGPLPDTPDGEAWWREHMGEFFVRRERVRVSADKSMITDPRWTCTYAEALAYIARHGGAMIREFVFESPWCDFNVQRGNAADSCAVDDYVALRDALRSMPNVHTLHLEPGLNLSRRGAQQIGAGLGACKNLQRLAIENPNGHTSHIGSMLCTLQLQCLRSLRIQEVEPSLHIVELVAACSGTLESLALGIRRPGCYTQQPRDDKHDHSRTFCTQLRRAMQRCARLETFELAYRVYERNKMTLTSALYALSGCTCPLRTLRLTGLHVSPAASEQFMRCIETRGAPWVDSVQALSVPTALLFAEVPCTGQTDFVLSPQCERVVCVLASLPRLSSLQIPWMYARRVMLAEILTHWAGVRWPWLCKHRTHKAKQWIEQCSAPDDEVIDMHPDSERLREHVRRLDAVLECQVTTGVGANDQQRQASRRECAAFRPHHDTNDVPEPHTDESYSICIPHDCMFDTAMTAVEQMPHIRVFDVPCTHDNVDMSADDARLIRRVCANGVVRTIGVIEPGVLNVLDAGALSCVLYVRLSLLGDVSGVANDRGTYRAIAEKLSSLPSLRAVWVNHEYYARQLRLHMRSGVRVHTD